MWLLFYTQVFGPKSQQRAIYDHAVAPIVNDVLEGYNCTVFAFGQTGTGKTYTMEGEMGQKVPKKNWTSSEKLLAASERFASSNF